MAGTTVAASTDYQKVEDDCTTTTVVHVLPPASTNQNDEKKKATVDVEPWYRTHRIFSYTFLFFWLLALLVHLIMSTNQVISRYLQHFGGKKVSITPFTLLCLSNLGALILYTPRMIYKYARPSVFRKARTVVHEGGGFFRLLWKHKSFIGMMCLYQLSIVSGSSLREVATYYTTSTYTQLILLSSPFIIYFMGILVFKTEKFSWLDMISCIFTVTGALIIIIASTTRATEDANGNPIKYEWKWFPDLTKIGSGFNWPNDFIGMIIALISSFFFSMKMNTVNRLSPSRMSNQTEDSSSSSATDPKQFVSIEESNAREHIMIAETQSSAALNSGIVEYEEQHQDTIVDNEQNQYQNNDEDNRSTHSNESFDQDSIEAPLLQQQHNENRINTQQQQQTEYVPPEISPEDLFYIQKYLLVLWPLIPMIVLEDWKIFANWDWVRWIFFVWFIIMNRLVAAVGEVICAKEIGGANYGIMFPIRIVIGLLLSSVILGEWIDNLVSIIGCLIVIVSITVFSVGKHKK